jgi:hypothetical protein
MTRRRWHKRPGYASRGSREPNLRFWCPVCNAFHASGAHTRILDPRAAEETAHEEATERARDTRRCPMCGGLNPGDATHSRCWSGR